MNTLQNSITPPLISDCTLRDGSHACNHQITEETYASYLRVADAAMVDYLEIGHGNGLGASSLQLGESLIREEKMIGLARSIVRNAAISTHVMPGFATMKRNIRQAVDLGVDLFRIAAHCTEADITQRHMEYVRSRDRQCWGVLMMSHMADNKTLLGEVKKMISYGAQAVVLMDSAGTLLPSDVYAKMKMLNGEFDSRFGFHAHNNLGLSVANSIAAMEGGAAIIDATTLGLGAGAGNCPLEMLVAVLFHMGLQDQMKIELTGILGVASTGRELFAKDLPVNTPETIVSSLAGVFSGFAKPVVRIARELGVSPIDIFFQLGKRKIIGGQEDIILEIANDLKHHPTP